ncbi:sensor domain-containing diguanylate cyclase [Sporosarcina sp. E16_3]|uniref:sensor domain-containing diguanylate cyclase n=1 Tax=Sporosarcina sp. E16_3 TaxID=2789293 RepID=UPI001A91B743|nr:sensor domain-containing diguanylate cyclase [Sporosarcina sp. E16_3]MBO0601272.1 sensor domain-containing diguanylate cyclase [Sporosarcina sp. E16_3]
MVGEIMLPFDTSLAEVLVDMVFIVKVEEDFTFTYAFFNRVAIEKTNLDQNAIGKTFSEVHDEELSILLNAEYGKVLNTNKTTTYEDSYKSPSGIRRYSEARLTPLFDKTGAYTHIVGVVKDVTNEKVAKLESEDSWNKLVESKSRYRSLFENNTDAVFTTDLSGVILSGNTAVEKISGYPLDELKGRALIEFLDTSDPVFSIKSFQQALEYGLNDYRITFLEKSGASVSCLVNFTPIEVRDKVVGIYAIVKDLRELDDMSNKFVESEKHFRIIAKNVQDVIVLINDKQEYLYVSPSSNQIYGYDSTEYTAKSLSWHVHPEDVSRMEQNFVQALREGTTCSIRLRIKHKFNGWLWSELKATPVYDERNKFKHMVIIIRDITLQKKHEEQLEYFAYRDFLTNLPNRRFFTDQLLMELDHFQNGGNGFTVFLLDIDHFKGINDQYGHEIGDCVIKEFGRRLCASIPKDAIAARLGGDEFILLLPKVETAKLAKETAINIQRAMEAQWSIKHTTLNVTASMGISLVLSTEATVSTILKNADNAMYEAKKSGGNSFEILCFR